MQKIRQASLLEELREACAKKEEIRPSAKNTVVGSGGVAGAASSSDSAVVSSLLACAAESQDPPKLPPSFILNLVKSKTRK